MSILAIAARLERTFRKIAEHEEVDAPVSEAKVTTIVDLLFHSEVAKHLPSAQDPERLMFQNDRRTLEKAFGEIKEELGKDHYPVDLVEITMRRVLASWEARYPVFKTDLSDPDHVAGAMEAIASIIAWLATREEGDDPVPKLRATARKAREHLLSARPSGSARSRQEGCVAFWENLDRKLGPSGSR